MPATIAAVGSRWATACYLSVGKAVFGFLNGYVEEEGIDKGTRFFPLEFLQHRARAARACRTRLYLAFAAAGAGRADALGMARATPADAAPGAFIAPAMALRLR